MIYRVTYTVRVTDPAAVLAAAARVAESEPPETVEDALSLLVGDSGWRPIETAPRDRSTILGWCHWHDEPVPVQWHRGKWQAVWDDSPVIESQSDFGTEYKMVDPLSHWRPLPAPPLGDGYEVEAAEVDHAGR